MILYSLIWVILKLVSNINKLYTHLSGLHILFAVIAILCTTNSINKYISFKVPIYIFLLIHKLYAYILHIHSIHDMNMYCTCLVNLKFPFPRVCCVFCSQLSVGSACFYDDTLAQHCSIHYYTFFCIYTYKMI